MGNCARGFKLFLVMGGRFNRCFCPEPPLHRWRKIWTVRPFGGFLKPYDTEGWTATLTDVFGGPTGTDVVGEAGTVAPQDFDYPDTSTILWQGTRYAGTAYHRLATYDDGVDSWTWERWEFNIYDVNTQTLLSVACGNTDAEWDALPHSSEGYLVSYDETLSATEYSFTGTFENYSNTETTTLVIPITYAGQVARGEAHLDFIFAGMTDAELTGSMNIDGQNWPWSNFPDNPGGAMVLNASKLRVYPVTGTLSCEDGTYTYTEWTPASNHTFEENTTIDGGAQIVIKGAGGWSTDNGIPFISSFGWPYPVEAGHFVPGGIGDDTKAVVQYICQSFTEAYNCTEMGNDSFIVEVNQAGVAQPTWGTEDCAGTALPAAHDLQPGHYLLTTSGIAKKFPASVSATFDIPTSPFFNIQLYFDSCCPP